jgi:hypothetical protein
MRPTHALITVAVAMLTAMLLAACSGVSTPSAPPSAPVTRVTVDALIADPAALDGKHVTVAGYLLATDAGASMCSLLLESYPPQCGGGLSVPGEIPGDVVAGLDKTSEPDLAQAMWGWVEVTGTFDASGSSGAPRIHISEIRLSSP